jgi:ABC-type amino acid transport substrate-binding protein
MRGMSRFVPMVVAALFAVPAFAQQPPPGDVEERALDIRNKPWKGDFQQMLDRRTIRVLVPYSRTLYFVDKGVERGITVEAVRDFERYINRKYVKDKRPVTVFVVPTTREKLLPQLNAGLGDIAAGNLTVTEARLKSVDFVAPDDFRPVREVIVTGPNAPELRSLDDLSGQTISVRPSTGAHRTAAGRARGRGQARDAERGAARHRRRGRLEGRDVGAGAAEHQGPRRPRAARRRAHRLGDPQGQSGVA